jgi:hypothetical protein
MRTTKRMRRDGGDVAHSVEHTHTHTQISISNLERSTHQLIVLPPPPCAPSPPTQPLPHRDNYRHGPTTNEAANLEHVARSGGKAPRRALLAAAPACFPHLKSPRRRTSDWCAAVPSLSRASKPTAHAEDQPVWPPRKEKGRTEKERERGRGERGRNDSNSFEKGEVGGC